MKLCSQILVCVVLLALALGMASAAETNASISKRKRVAVVNFEVPDSVYSVWGGEGHAAAERLGHVLADMMITSLVNSGSFDVIERTELEKVLKEHNLSADGLLDPKTAPKAGKILGVDYIIGGKITEFGVKKKSSGGLGILTGGLLGVDYQKSTARVVIDARMIDTTTAKIVLAKQGTGENSETKLNFGGSDFSHFLLNVNFSTSEWTNSRLGRATRTAVDKVIEQFTEMFPPETTVRAILADGTMVLGLGKFAGITVGTKFEVMRSNPVIDDETGEVLYDDRASLGLVEVIDVQDNACKAKAVSPFPAGKEAKKGDVAVLKKEKKKDDK